MAYSSKSPAPSAENWEHDFMRACVSASRHITCLRKPDRYTYISHNEIVDRIGTDRFKTDAGVFFPDLLDGVRFSDGSERIGPTEIDRNTEQLEDTPTAIKNKRKTVEKTFRVIRKWVGSRQYKTDLQHDGDFFVHIVTNGKQHMENMIDVALKVKPEGYNYLLFSFVGGFGDFMYPPKYIFPLLDEPCYRAGRDPIILNTP